VGKTLVLPLVMNEITGKNLLRSNPVERRMVNGLRGSLKCTDSEWASWTDNDSIAITLDMGGRKKLKSLSFGCLNDFGMGVHKPKSVEILLSDNDLSYWKVAEKKYTMDEIFAEVREVEDLSFEIDDASRYVRIILRGAGKCPATHVRPGQDAKVYVDEIMVEVEKVEPRK
jgi:hexosaminidase